MIQQLGNFHGFNRVLHVEHAITICRPSAREVSEHCLFWSEDRQKEFFNVVYDHGSTDDHMYTYIDEQRYIEDQDKQVDTIFEDSDGSFFKPIPMTVGGMVFLSNGNRKFK